MTINWNRQIPGANNNPSTDQPLMLQNNDAVYSFVGVDHNNFNASNSGTHAHVTYVAPVADPSLAASQVQIYPKTFTGTAASILETYAAIRPSSGNQIVGYSPIVKAYARMITAGAGGPFPANILVTANSLNANVASVTQTSATAITITFSQALPTDTYAVFMASPTGSFRPSYTRTTTTLTLSFSQSTNTELTIMVI